MNKPDLLKPTLIAGLIAGIIVSIPILGGVLTCCVCIKFWAPGVLGVLLYNKAAKPLGYPVRAGDGALVGMVSGVFAGITHSIINVAKMAIVGNAAEQARIDEALAGLSPDQQWLADWIRGVLASSQSIGGMIIMLLIATFLFALFSAISGMVAAMVAGSKGRGPQGGSQWYPPSGSPSAPTTPHVPPEPPPSAFGPGGSA